MTDVETSVYVGLSGKSHLVGRLWTPTRKDKTTELGLSRSQIDRMSSAFEHAEIKKRYSKFRHCVLCAVCQAPIATKIKLFVANPAIVKQTAQCSTSC